MSCGSDGVGQKLTHSTVTWPEPHYYDKKRGFVQCGKRGGVASWVRGGDSQGSEKNGIFRQEPHSLRIGVFDVGVALRDSGFGGKLMRGSCPGAKLEDLHPRVRRIRYVDAVAGIDPQSARNEKLSNSAAGLSKRTHRRSIRFVDGDDGSGNITYVDVSVPIYGQPIGPSNAGKNTITSSAVAVEIQDLNARLLGIENHNSVIAHGDLRRRDELSAAIAVPVLAHTFQNVALQIEDKNQIARGIGKI